MLPRITSLALFAVAAAVAASVVFWGFKLLTRTPALPAHATLAATPLAAAPDWSRMLGAEPVLAPVVAAAEPPPDARYQLIGVLAPRAGEQRSRGGVALIAVDGKPARAFRVGAVVDGNTVLQAVQARAVSLGPRDGPTQATLQMPPLPVAATGSLPNLPNPQPTPEAASVIVPPPPSQPRTPPGRQPPPMAATDGTLLTPSAMPGSQNQPLGRAGLQTR